MHTAAEMRNLIEAWESSELTQREFAEQEGVSYTAFQYWRRRLKELAEEEEPDVVPLLVVDSTEDRLRPERIEIRVDPDVSISVPPGFNEVELRRVLAVVRAC